MQVILLLGARDTPVDGVDDYCRLLSNSLAQTGVKIAVERFPWREVGWLRAFLWLWKSSRNWTGWIVLQYTALQWSDHGIPVNLPSVFAILRLRGLRRAIVFHDANPYPVRKPFDRIRRAIQVFVMHWICSGADRVITTIDAKSMPWLGEFREKSVCIPVGANIPAANRRQSHRSSNGRKAVAVFSLTPGATLVPEAETIARVVSAAARRNGGLRLVVLGRNSHEAEETLKSSLNGSDVELRVLGLLPPKDIAEEIAACDALLFVREGVSSRRGSAIAGIMQGLPIVAYQGPETAFPITEAGLALAPEGDREALAAVLSGVIADDELRSRLSGRSILARDRYFSWDSVASRYRDALRLN